MDRIEYRKMASFSFFLLILSQFSGSAFSQYSLEIEISGIRNNQGVIMIQLLNSSQEVVDQVKGVIKDDSCVVTFTNLAPSKYAIQYYQDENLNEKLDKNKLGIPTEGYGFSNDAYGMFGPKPFKYWLFDLNSDKKVALRIKY